MNREAHKETTSDDIMVSVVMVAYNSAPYIGEAIAGVVRQKRDFKVQLVICDDASTDDTGKIVADWAAKYPGVIDYHRNERNLGVQGNYLKALSLCRGKYITMCDADDYWCCRTKLSRQVAYMETHPGCTVCYHRVVNYYEATGEMSLSNGGGAVETTAEGLASRNVITNLSVMYRASALDVPNLPSWLGEIRLIDYALHMLAASRGSLHYMSRPMGVYRHLPTAIWSQAEQTRRMQMAIDVRRHLIAELSDRPELTAPLERSCKAMLDNATHPASPARKPLLSRIRALVSRHIPVPKP